eukprot:535774_1
MQDGAERALWLQFVFLISGISQTCLTNLISYHGGASPATLLPVFMSYLASASVYFLPKNKPSTCDTISDEKMNPNTMMNSPHHHKHRLHSFNWRDMMTRNELKMMFIAFYDLICGIISFLSLVWSGSAIYQLVYSSIIIVTATFRHFLLPNKKLSL